MCKENCTYFVPVYWSILARHSLHTSSQDDMHTQQLCRVTSLCRISAIPSVVWPSATKSKSLLVCSGVQKSGLYSQKS